MKLLFGTTNPSKLNSMKEGLQPLGIELIGLNDLHCPLPEVNESGKDPLENARIKAETYYQAFKMPVFSCDSGLYFDGLEEDLQPGTHIRRVQGKHLNDQEMINYYRDLVAQHGGTLSCAYQNAIYLIMDEEHHFSCMDQSISEPFIMVDQPHPTLTPGFPLDSLSKDLRTDKYFIELDNDEKNNWNYRTGIQVFFKKAFASLITSHPLSEEDKQELCHWHYPGEYSIYDLPHYDEIHQKQIFFCDPKKEQNYHGYSLQGTLIGFTNIHEEEKEIFIGIGVHPDYCNQGYGQAILNLVSEFCKEKYPHKPLYLEVRTFNKRAIQAYQKAGFKIDRTITQETYIGQGTFYRMVKER